MQRRRRRTRAGAGLIILGVVVVVGLVVYGLYWLLYLRHFESTDDAYVGGDVVSITSRENGTVLRCTATTHKACGAVSF